MVELKQELVDRLNEGDERAFEEVYQHYRKLVYYMAITHLRSASEAEDIVQEVFVDVFKHKDKMKSPQALTIWVNKITYSRCMDAIRKKKEPFHTNYDNNMDDIENTSIDADVMGVINRTYVNEAIQSCLLEMNDELKMVGLLRFYEELPLQDIADILEIPIGTVKSRLHTVKDVLRTKLKDYGFSKVVSIVFLMPGNIKYVFKTLQNSTPSKPHRYAKGAIQGVMLLTGLFAIGIITILVKPEQVITNDTYEIMYDTEVTNKDIEVTVQPSTYDHILINDKKTNKITRNGTYTISVVKDKQVFNHVSIKISTIDKDIPKVLNYTQGDGYIILYLKDKGSEINVSSIQVTDSDDQIIDFKYKKENKSVTFPSKDNKTYRVYVEDQANNSVTVDCQYQ